MAKIMLFGTYTITGIPSQISAWLEEYNKQGHEFIVGDSKGAEAAFHKVLSSIGANKVTIYCMGNPRSNVYDFPVKMFNTSYNEDAKQATITASDNSIEPFIIDDIEKEMDIPYNSKWYEFKDRQLINDCDVAIGLYDGENKGTAHIIQLLNINNKTCYTFTL